MYDCCFLSENGYLSNKNFCMAWPYSMQTTQQASSLLQIFPCVTFKQSDAFYVSRQNNKMTYPTCSILDRCSSLVARMLVYTAWFCYFMVLYVFNKTSFWWKYTIIGVTGQGVRRDICKKVVTMKMILYHTHTHKKTINSCGSMTNMSKITDSYVNHIFLWQTSWKILWVLDDYFLYWNSSLKSYFSFCLMSNHSLLVKLSDDGY